MAWRTLRLRQQVLVKDSVLPKKEMAADVAGAHQKTVGADKNYDMNVSSTPRLHCLTPFISSLDSCP